LGKVALLSGVWASDLLRYRPKWHRCEYCDGQPNTSHRLDWYEPNSPNAFAYEQHILLQLVNPTLEDAAYLFQRIYLDPEDYRLLPDHQIWPFHGISQRAGIIGRITTNHFDDKIDRWIF
jgi:hypothetical protein